MTTTETKTKPDFAKLAELIRANDLAVTMAFCQTHGITPEMISEHLGTTLSTIPLVARLRAAG